MNDSQSGYLGLSKKDKSRLLMDMVMRMVMHYGFWFGEVRHQMGMEPALDMMDTVTPKAMKIAMHRMAETLGFAMQDDLPKALSDMDEDLMNRCLQDLAKNWLVMDGVWFQTVESAHGMNDAKRCNDSCWGKFSPYEAHGIKKFLELGKNPGLTGLKKALAFRMYSFINTQSIVDEGPQSFVFQMNACRVQAARKRKGMPDYPCKTAGLVEYTYFARAIDPRIKTACIGCPPDPHPDEWFCAWRFTIEQ
ncbi:MAG TPA: DUF6125 family protein [Desulfotignum sp.]|nr:DUF6125 family protein [Desulfotignum sp.]